MAKKRRSLKKSSVKRFSQRRPIDLHLDVLGNKTRMDVYTRDRRFRKKSIPLFDSLTNIVKRAQNIQKVVQQPYKPVIDMMSERKKKVCTRRAEKRRALFRIGRAGKGVAGPVVKILTAASKVRCK